MRELLLAMGRDPDADAELAGTPARVVEAYASELLSGYAVDVKALLGDGEAVSAHPLSGFVALRGVAVSTICPHHLLLSLGSATVAYKPGKRLFGLGTLAALVDAYARRLTLQEAIGENVVQALVEHGGAEAAYCEIKLVHGCLVARGSKQQNTELTTTARRGPIDPAELALSLGVKLEGSR